MFEQAPLGIALIDSLDGRILAVNQRFADIVGRSRAELARIDWMRITHPDDIQADLDNMARLNAGEIGGFQMNKRYFRPDGGIVWASMTIAPVKVERGERPRHLAMIEDITERLRTEAELAEARDRSARRESEERLRLAIDGAHLGTWHWHLPSNELVWSATCKALFGLPPDSTISYDEFLEILHPDDRQSVDWLVRQSLASHDDFAADYRVIWPDGSIHWISALGRVFLAADGSAERMEGVTFDITARKRDEELLRRASAEMEARNRINRVFLTVPGEGMYTEVLKIVLETLQSPYGVFGYLDEMGDLVVPTMTRTVWDQCQMTDKSYVFKRDEWGDSIWPTAIRQKRCLHSNEVSSRTPKGHIPITRNISLPLIHQGEAVGLLQVGNKATDYQAEDIALLQTLGDTIAPVLHARIVSEREDAARQAAERSLQESEARFRQLIETLPQLIWTTWPDGHCDYLSPQWIAYTGVAAAPQLDFGWLDQVHPDDRQSCIDQWMAFVQAGVPCEFEFRLRRHDGEYRWFRTFGVPLRDGAGAIIKWVGCNLDIETLKRAEREQAEYQQRLERDVTRRTAELQASNADLEAFSYSVSHDLRAPLRAIDGFIAILDEDYGPRLDEEGHRLFGIVQDNARKMGRLIDDILTFSRAGRLEMEVTEVDMNALVDEVWQALAEQRGQRKIEFHRDELAPCRGDLRALRQIWLNLLANAIKFSRGRDPAVIGVYAEPGDDLNWYAVRDNGAGFKPDYVGKLFGLFQRLHGMDEFEGTGVGLAIVKRFVQKHGGQVGAKGVPDGGATFRFALPTRHG